MASEQVLVEEKITGKPLTEWYGGNGEESPAHRRLAEAGSDVFLQMILTDNFFHADIHPGLCGSCAQVTHTPPPKVCCHGQWWNQHSTLTYKTAFRPRLLSRKWPVCRASVQGKMPERERATDGRHSVIRNPAGPVLHLHRCWRALRIAR